MDGLRELDRIGSHIAGKYRLEMILGRGGMGTVYRATHTWTGRPVAVKLLHHEHAHDASSVTRFLREARAAAAVRHPNAVDVLDMGQDEAGLAYLVLELLEGDTLAAYLEAQKRLSVDEVVRCLVPVLDALEELHRAGVVHRDLKPANIFLARATRGGIIPKLLDFGVAKELEPQSAGLVTTAGIVVGTPAYMAPEQASGNGNVGPWTDIWAAGIVLYECLTGELPFAAPTPSLMLVDVMTKTAPRLAVKRPDLPPAICVVVDRALAKDPSERFPSCIAMGEALCQAAGVAHPASVVTAPVRAPVAFAETQAMRTPVPPHIGTSPATGLPQRSEPPATGPTATAGHLRSPVLWRTGMAAAVVVLGIGSGLLLRSTLLSREPEVSGPPPVPVAAPVVPEPAAPAPVAAPPSPSIPTLAPLPAALPPNAESAASAVVPEVAPKPSASERAEARKQRKRRTILPAEPQEAAPVIRTVAPVAKPAPAGPAVEREW